MLRKNIEPALQVGDKVVQVGPAEWGAFSDFIEAVGNADLPLPKLDTDGLRQRLNGIQATASTGTIDMGDVIGIVFEFISTNLATVCAWVGKQRSLLLPLLRATTNLTPEEAQSLTAGQVLRVCRASFRELIDDGIFTEAAGFFGELVGLHPAESPPKPANETSQSPPASMPASAAA